jgi:hypothetical protein
MTHSQLPPKASVDTDNPEQRLWPAAQDPNIPNEYLNAVSRLMNPPSHLGNVQGTADKRSMVYVTGACNEPQAIIYIGFDPVVKLKGLTKSGELYQNRSGEG